MAKKSKVTLHPSYVIGDISPRLFGAFLEPIGNFVNGWMWCPDHPTADDMGFRKDFMDGLKEAGLNTIRFGGNFVSGWRWKDNIGPVESRRQIFDRSRAAIIPKEIGVDEYLTWGERVGAEIMYTLNLGTDGLNEAIDLIDYTNADDGAYWSEERKKNGHPAPYKVKTWYLGNEMDGPWQMGSYEKDPLGYGNLAREVSKMLKLTDPSVETVACVSSCPCMTHYPSWDQTVLETCYELVDMISLHHYHHAPIGDIPKLMAGIQGYENYINTEIALCDLIKTKLRSKRTMYLSFDEFGSMCRPSSPATPGMNGNLPEKMFFEFPEAPYTYQSPNEFKDFPGSNGGEMPGAVANACVFLAFMRHADRVKIGCATSGLSMCCSADAAHTWKSASFYPIAAFIKYAKGKSILPIVDSETFSVEPYAGDDQNQYNGFEDVPYIQAAAALNEADGEFTVFVGNTDWADAHDFTLDVSNFAGYTFVEHLEMYSDDPDARNTYEDQDVLTLKKNPDAKCEGGVVTAELKPISWNVFRFKK